MVGNNTPVFFVRDPSKFQDFIHSQKRLPDTNLRSNDMQWDFWTLSPESAHQVTILMSDRGHAAHLAPHERLQQPHLPVGERRRREVLGQVPLQDRPGRSRTSPTTRPTAMVAEEPDFHLRDLYDSIAAGDASVVDARDADHAVRRRGRLPLQPVRPDEGVAARRLPADRRSGAWCSTATRRTTSPRSSRRRSSPPTWCAGSARARTRCCSGGCSATPTRTATGSAPTTCSCRSTSPKAPVHSYNKDGAMRYRAQRRPAGVRAQQLRRPGRPTRASATTVWGVEGARSIRSRVHAAPRGRRLRPARHAVPRGHVADRRRSPGRRTSSATRPTRSRPEVQERVIAYWTSVDGKLGAAVAEGICNAPSANGAAARGRGPVGSGASTGL